MDLLVRLYETEKHKSKIVHVIEYGKDHRGKEYVKCEERRGRLILGTHCEWANAEKSESKCTLCDVSNSSYTVKAERIADFIEHWERIITPYSYENHEKRAIKTVIEQLRFLR